MTAEEVPPVNKQKDHLLERILGNYQLKERIGGGAFGKVYRAEHTKLGVSYAAKVLHPSIIHNERLLKRFKREAQLAGQMRHENIVFIADYDIAEDVGPYIIMEFLEGQTLEALLEKEQFLDVNRTHKLMEQICSAIETAHEHGVIHRDLKPENIFLASRKGREHIKLLDFGIASIQQGAESLTHTGVTVGTPQYMAPEQCQGKPPIPQTDIYALGLMLFFMLTGRLPFVGTHPHQLMAQQLMTPPPPLGDAFSKELNQYLHQMLAKQPQDRPESISDVWTSLSRLLDESAQPKTIKMNSFTMQSPPPDALNQQSSPPSDQAHASDIILLTQRKDSATDLLKDTQPDEVFESFKASREQLLTQPPPKKPEDRRTFPRVNMSFLVEFRMESVQEFVNEYACDLSLGGLFLRTDNPWNVGETFHLRFLIDDGKKLIEGLGRVQHVTHPGGNRPAGMGIEFVELDKESWKFVAEVVQKQLAEKKP